MMSNHQSITGFHHGAVETVERIEGLPGFQTGTKPSMALESLRKVLRSLGLGEGGRESPRHVQSEGRTLQPVAVLSKCDRSEERL